VGGGTGRCRRDRCSGQRRRETRCARNGASGCRDRHARGCRSGGAHDQGCGSTGRSSGEQREQAPTVHTTAVVVATLDVVAWRFAASSGGLDGHLGRSDVVGCPTGPVARTCSAAQVDDPTARRRLVTRAGEGFEAVEVLVEGADQLRSPTNRRHRVGHVWLKRLTSIEAHPSDRDRNGCVGAAPPSRCRPRGRTARSHTRSRERTRPAQDRRPSADRASVAHAVITPLASSDGGLEHMLNA
jgi:hypothetical protein